LRSEWRARHRRPTCSGTSNPPRASARPAGTKRAHNWCARRSAVLRGGYLARANDCTQIAYDRRPRQGIALRAPCRRRNRPLGASHDAVGVPDGLAGPAPLQEANHRTQITYNQTFARPTYGPTRCGPRSWWSGFFPVGALERLRSMRDGLFVHGSGVFRAALPGARCSDVRSGRCRHNVRGPGPRRRVSLRPRRHAPASPSGATDEASACRRTSSWPGLRAKR